MDYHTLMGYVPLPDLLSLKRVLFVGPHPDDIEISSGGLVKKLINLGKEVYFLIVTDGGAGSKDPNITSEELVLKRKEESRLAAEYLQVKKVEVLDFPDGGIYKPEEMSVEIAKRIIDIHPDAVFAPDPLLPTETHPDHLNCAKAVTNALGISQFRLSALRHGIEIDKDQTLPSGINLVYYYTHRPNVIIALDKDEFDAKIEAILKHESQIDESFAGIKMYLYYKATTLGREIGSEYAEGYFAMGPVHQHCFLEKI